MGPSTPMKGIFTIILAYLLCNIARNVEAGSVGSEDLHETQAVRSNPGHIENPLALIHPENIKIMLNGSATVSVSPNVVNNGDMVTITVNNTRPGVKDWIGAYSPIPFPSPPSSPLFSGAKYSDISNTIPRNITDVVPVKWSFLAHIASGTYMSTGVVSLRFTMTNMRAPVAFYLFSNGLTHPILLSISDTIVTFVDYNAPLKPRVVPTGDPDVMTLLWSSATSAQPLLKWGDKSGGPYTNIIDAETQTIRREDLCGAPATARGWHDLGLIHSANLTGMTRYARAAVYYVFGDLATDDFSDEHVLYLPPLPGDHSIPTSLIVFGDLGRGSADDGKTWEEYGRPAFNTTAMIASKEIDIPKAVRADAGVHYIHHFGDISYATGYLSVWDSFLDMLAPVASKVPYATGLGNHESDFPGTVSFFQGTDSGGECGVCSAGLLPLPIAQWPPSSKPPLRGNVPLPANINTPWYSVNVGMVHLVVLSSEHDFRVGSVQYTWFEADLAYVNRTVTPWVMVSSHRPMYIDSVFGGAVGSDITTMQLLQQELEPLFWKYRVNLGMYGHNHAVQRLSAAYGGKLVQRSEAVQSADGVTRWTHANPQATVHMVAGTGGAAFTINNNVANPPEWSERVFFRYGYARVIVTNASLLDWEWVDNISGEILDRMRIIQDDPTAPWQLPIDKSDSLSAGAIGGIVVAGVVGFLAAVWGVLTVRRKNREGQCYGRRTVGSASTPDNVTYHTLDTNLLSHT